MLADIPKVMAPLLHLGGYMGSCLVDGESGMCLAKDGGAHIDLEVASACNAEVLAAKRRTIKALRLDDDIEDILITLGTQYHLIRPLRKRPSLFLYLVLDKRFANLAYARLSLVAAEAKCVAETTT
jgi:predicted regulator of Ras-like GTPase activity (Roadblock/LC7/MglB family)